MIQPDPGPRPRFQKCSCCLNNSLPPSSLTTNYELFFLSSYDSLSNKDVHKTQKYEGVTNLIEHPTQMRPPSI